MATVLGAAALPRRLTQLYSDNKRTYEALVQTRQTGPELSPLHMKLRIQKDRLVAWGLQWSDRSAAAAAKSGDKGGDIDGSLDRAGLGDLVESIMSSIRELLDEAENLQPQPRALVMPRSAGKAALMAADPVVTSGDWTSGNLKRLEEIVKDLTTSIDTLCDLSRPRAAAQDPPSSPSRAAKHDAVKAPAVRPVSMYAADQRNSSPARRDDLTDMTYIDPSMLRLRAAHSRSTSSPPSYESVAAGSENRVIAYFSLPSTKAESSGTPTASTPGDPSEVAVLLDYRQHLPVSSSTSKSIPRPDGARFEELLLAILRFSEWKTSAYTGILKLNGWTVDRQKTRFAYVYEIPRPIGAPERSPPQQQPRSLLSFLQNGSDADASNVPCLEHRFRLALNLALSLMRLHELNITHRNINSSNVLFFTESADYQKSERIWKSPLIRKPYLTGLHQQSSGTASYDKESSFSGVYYHPRLAGASPVPYEAVHDHYSLGLILLEIGLWMPIGKFWKSKYTIDDFKTRLQDIYLKKLSGKCSDTYMQAVSFCMNAAEKFRASPEVDASEQEQQTQEFHKNVIRALERCCMLDDDEAEKEIIEAFAAEPAAETEAKDTEASAQELRDTQDAIEASKKLEEMAPVMLPKPQTPTSKIKVWSHDIPNLYNDYWKSTFFPKLEKILRKALSRWESYTIDLFLAGTHPDTARPTIYMECASTSKVRKILRHLNKDMRLFEIKVVPGQITRSKAPKKKLKKAKTTRAGADGAPDPKDLNPCYQEKPGFGASIGAYLDDSHLPPVTFGGAVLVDGEPFGMSVHHMLEDDEDMMLALDDSVDLHRSMGSRSDDTEKDIEGMQSRISNLHPFEYPEHPSTDDTSSVGFSCSEASEADYGPSASLEAVYPFELDAEDESMYDESLDETANDDEFWLREDSDAMSTCSDEDDEEPDMGDTAGVVPGSSEAHLVTQPAIDDVKDGFFPCAEDADFEHLTSHTLGYVHASSGLRRTRANDMIHEMDWALIKINDTRSHCLESLNKPPVSPTGFECPRPTAIVSSDSLSSRSVHSHARSSGLFARGTILPTMRLVRMPGRISPSHSWQIKGNFGPGGDSGAWVFDDASGAVCGHVLAYSQRSKVAYIAPMDVMVEDMQRVLGKKVSLPGAAEEEIEVAEVAEAEELHAKAGSPVVPTTPPVLPRYDSDQSRGTSDSKSRRGASPREFAYWSHMTAGR